MASRLQQQQQQLEFPISPRVGAALCISLWSHLFLIPPYPTRPFADQVIIVTGSNRGLGLEAAHHLYRLNCLRLILANPFIPRCNRNMGRSILFLVRPVALKPAV
ncbi:hypothetical protein BJX61DRAFT_543666 [Aspergillus egyptiacus]|nr:hypothetical protein BJX61DRAFT_543666 [Aspergillus egyptiacus]